jgi:hypothetical protein
MAIALCRYVRRRLGERVRLRLTPEVRFIHDDAVDRGERVLSLLSRLRDEEDEELSSGSSSETDGSEAQDASGDAAGVSLRSNDGFLDLEALGVAEGSTGSEDASEREDSPFLEGVGDDEYDDMPQTSTFFSADMFPDARPELEMAAIKEKGDNWRGGGKKVAMDRRKRYVQPKR